MRSRPLLSIVSPVYRAEDIVDELVKRICDETSKITSNFEIVLVDDGSPDDSWQKIEENHRREHRVKGVKFSRNFGQHYAITAGIYEALGDNVVVIDCDLQDNPKYIIDLYNRSLEGFDIVYTVKKNREHSLFKNLTARLYFRIFKYLSDIQGATANIGSYSLINRKVVDAFRRIHDHHRHYVMVLMMLGFRSASIEVVHERRFQGRSSYAFRKLIKHALDGITSQSDKLLRLSVSLGFYCFMVAMIWLFYLIVQYFSSGIRPGYTSIACLILLSTGLTLMSLGVLGIYIGKIFEQVKNRPLYFIEKQVGFAQQDSSEAP